MLPQLWCAASWHRTTRAERDRALSRARPNRKLLPKVLIRAYAVCAARIAPGGAGARCNAGNGGINARARRAGIAGARIIIVAACIGLAFDAKSGRIAQLALRAIVVVITFRIARACAVLAALSVQAVIIIPALNARASDAEIRAGAIVVRRAFRWIHVNRAAPNQGSGGTDQRNTTPTS